MKDSGKFPYWAGGDMGNFIGRMIGAVLGLCFAGGGAVLLVTTVVPLFKAWQETKTWQPAWAQVESVGGADNETKASYRYTIDGVDYSGRRVYLADFKDNIGNYHKNFQAHLKSLQRTETHVAIWVDPENAGEAVIDREIRWGLLLLIVGFCSAFIVVGLAVCLASIFARNGKKTQQPATAELKRQWEQKKSGNPDYHEGFIEFRRFRLHELQKEAEDETSARQTGELWRQKKEWRTSRIRSEARSTTLAMWIFAMLWCGVSSPILFFLKSELLSGNYLALIGLIFPLIGIFLLAKAIAMSREYRRFGMVEYSMDPYPGAIGGNVGGSMEIRDVQEAGALFRVKLECVFSHESGSSDDKSRFETIRWAEEGSAGTARIAGGVRLEFRFDVPRDLPESDVGRTGDYHFWRLQVTADLPGVDLNRSYIIPVMKTETADHSRHVRHDLSRQAQEAREEAAERSRRALQSGDFAATGLAGSVRIRKIDRGVLLIYPMFRNKMLTVIAFLVSASFGGFAAGIPFGFSGQGLVGVLAFIVAVPFALIGLIAACVALYLPLNNMRVTISQGRVTVLRRLAVLPIFFKRINSSDIRELSVDRSGSTGQGTGKVEHFRIVAHSKTGDTVTLGEDIDGLDLAEQFKDYLWQKIHAAS
jgi:hypothetical protein